MKISHLQINRLATQHNTSVDLVDLLTSWFGVDEVDSILRMKPHHLHKTIRVNLLKLTRKEAIERLKKENIVCKRIKEVPEGLIVTQGQTKIGSCQSYLNGEIMPQGYGSMLAVHALDPLPGETILDVAAAPGGKSCFIAERMKNTGTLIANDASSVRIPSLISNLARHGISNSVVTLQDGMILNLPQVDRVLLDAPCTGEGLIVSQISRRKSRKIMDHYHLQKVQITLLNKAISLLKPGGVCIYSTCSLSPIENEEVITQVLGKVTVLDLEVPGLQGFSQIHPDLVKAKRLLPSIHKCDGFFIIKLQKGFN
ncbi:MAG: RsmB/NOP family class I SAM-dependent RNA methyltransferase [Candidatus Kariarchaeaceae archaeon]|jgi:ribosomal RNA methyltransferase Nop2